MKRLLPLMLIASAHAEFYSGNKLLELMQGSHTEQMAALGYVIGAADATRGVGHCIPSQVTAGQVNDMVKQQLENNPSLRHITADIHVVYALGKAWPCPKKEKGQSL